MSGAAPEPGPAYETANIHLNVSGEERAFPVTVPLGERTLLDLLPAARELTDQATAAAVDQARAQGRAVSCRAGCAACCRELVAISLAEAQDLADLVAALPPERQAAVRARFAEALRRLEASGLLDPGEVPGERALHAAAGSSRLAAACEVAQRYFAEQIPCPFLENESCSIYPQRPMVCREYHVTSPAERCARLYEVSVDRLRGPIQMTGVLARTAHRAAGVPVQTFPLVLALEWADAQGSALARAQDGLGLFRALIGEIDPGYDEVDAAQD
jgi:Fe-S-cluster containining protein